MRASLLLFFILSTLLLVIWISLNGTLFIGLGLLALFLVVITIGYSDIVVLFLLGARSVRSSDEKDFFESTSQEAYKLALSMPRLYYYNGSLDRSFVLQNRQKISIVLSKHLLEVCTTEELSAISFELLLQVKKNMAAKRTKSMFFLGSMFWTIHSVVAIILAFIPIKSLKLSVDWFINFLLYPTLALLFQFIMGKGYYKKLGLFLNEFPKEKKLLLNLGLKLRSPDDYYSLPTRKILELSSVYKSRHFQNVTALEFLPHEYDYLFKNERV